MASKTFLALLAALVLQGGALAGPLFVTSSDSGTAVFDPYRWSLAGTLEHSRDPSQLVFEEDGARLWTISTDGKALNEVDLDSNRVLRRLDPGFPPLALCPAGNGRMLVASARGDLLRLMDTRQGGPPGGSLELPGKPLALFPLPDGRRAAALLSLPAGPSAVSGTAVEILLARSLSPTQTVDLPFPAWDLAFSGDGRYLAASHEREGLVSLVDLRGRRLTRQIQVGPGPRGLALSRDGGLLWVAHRQKDRPTGCVSLVDLGADRVVATRDLVGEVRGLALLPAQGARPAQVVVAAVIPEAQRTGMLYSLDPGLKRILDDQPLAGRPLRVLSPVSAAPPGPSAPAPVQVSRAAGTAATPAADASGLGGFLKAGFEGRVLDRRGGGPLARARVWAVNPAGRTFPGTVDGRGDYRIPGLPWGSYRVEARASGYRDLTTPARTLAFTSALRLDLELIPLPPPK